eukprot:7392692-Karenia_brevis.AAC.1
MNTIWWLLRYSAQYGHHSWEHTGLRSNPGGSQDLKRNDDDGRPLNLPGPTEARDTGNPRRKRGGERRYEFC